MAICQSCGNGNGTDEDHVCPFQQDIWGNDEEACNCCEDCEQNCCNDI